MRILVTVPLGWRSIAVILGNAVLGDGVLGYGDEMKFEARFGNRVVFIGL